MRNIFFTLICSATPIYVSQAHAQNLGQSESADTLSPEEETRRADDAQDTKPVEVESEKKNRPKLSDRIKSVQRRMFLKKGRLELSPYFGTDLNDPFFQHFLLGSGLAYHLAETFAIEARGGFVFASAKQSAIRFVRQSADSIIQDPPEFKYHADLNFNWAPVYGKLSLMGESILHFDTFLSAGGGVFGTDAGANPAINVGLGQRYITSSWLAIRFEIRDYVFIDSRNGQSDLQNLMLFTVSLSTFFPTSFEYQYQ